MLRHLVPIVAATLLLLIVWASAVPLFHWFVVDDGSDELAARESQWHGLSVDSYEFVVRKNCFCGPPANMPVKIIVRDSLTIAAYDPSTGNADSGDRIEGVPDSVPALFAEVESAIAAQPLTLEVEYDDTYGFPVRIQVDPGEQNSDDEYGFEVSGFRERHTDFPVP